MGESLIRASLPSVKEEPFDDDAQALPSPPSELDRDVLCPICMQIIKDAFSTPCGHSFCYMCIATHLHNKSDCPCCGHYLTTGLLFPNFLLNKLLMRTSAEQIAKKSNPFEQLHQALQQGCKVSAKELSNLLSVLSEKKRKMEQEEAEMNIQIMLDFLNCLRNQKLEELSEIKTDLQYIKEDIDSVVRHRVELNRARDRCPLKIRKLADDTSGKTLYPLLIDKDQSRRIYACPVRQEKYQDARPACTSQMATVSSYMLQNKDGQTKLNLQPLSQSGSNLAKRRKVHAQFNDLQECYLQKRRYWAKQHKQNEQDSNANNREGYHPGLQDFESVLSSFIRYSRLSVIAELGHGDIFHSANIVSSIEFDRDDELFATAGISRRIKIFEFSSVVNEPSTEAQFPITEMSTRSKLSCVSWNNYTKSHIASSDYEGIVTVWDVTTRQSVMEYEEHEKRAWSVDFSLTEPSMLVSGSDDCKVKIWHTKQEASAINIDVKANICSVKYNPGSSIFVAVGSADHRVYYYDLRNVSQPMHIFSGHQKAVSYVKFLSSSELVSASTDSTLSLWDVKKNVPLRTFRGHTNEKNFVGLTASSEYIACGSETDEVFVYHKAISRPAACHRFSHPDLEDRASDIGCNFISAVCWKSDSLTMLAANSQGTMKVLTLAA